MKKMDTKMITTLGLLVALQIVLSRFLSIQAWNIKFSFSFIPYVVSAILFGPIPTGLMAAVSDILGAILFPAGSYFPGFTLSAFCTGILFGVCFGKKQTVPRVLGAVVLNQVIISLLANTLWLSVLYSSAFLPLMSTRAIQCAIQGPVQFVTILAVSHVMNGYVRRILA